MEIINKTINFLKFPVIFIFFAFLAFYVSYNLTDADYFFHAKSGEYIVPQAIPNDFLSNEERRGPTMNGFTRCWFIFFLKIGGLSDFSFCLRLFSACLFLFSPFLPLRWNGHLVSRFFSTDFISPSAVSRCGRIISVFFF